MVVPKLGKKGSTADGSSKASPKHMKQKAVIKTGKARAGKPDLSGVLSPMVRKGARKFKQQLAAAAEAEVADLQVQAAKGSTSDAKDAKLGKKQASVAEEAPESAKKLTGGRKSAPAEASETLVKGGQKRGKKDLSGTLSPMVKKMSRKLKQQQQGAVEESAEPEPEQPGSAKKPKKENRSQELLNAIRRTIASVPFAGAGIAGVRLHPGVLTSFDGDGFPSMRTVIPDEIAEDFSEIRIRTDMATRKVQEIQKNPKVSLHYQDQRGRGGWVTIKADAKVDALAGVGGDSVEIALRPTRCECVSYVEDMSADDGAGWKPAVLVPHAVGGGGWRRSQ